MMELNRVYSIAMHEKLALSPTVINSDEEDGIYTVPPDADDDESEFILIGCFLTNQNSQFEA